MDDRYITEVRCIPLCELGGADLGTVGNQLIGWLRELMFYSPCKVSVVWPLEEDGTFVIWLRTSSRCFRIVADEQYIGAMALTITPRQGEHWLRTRDLPDGPFSRETFNEILGAIALYGMVFTCNHGDD